MLEAQGDIYDDRHCVSVRQPLIFRNLSMSGSTYSMVTSIRVAVVVGRAFRAMSRERFSY